MIYCFLVDEESLYFVAGLGVFVGVIGLIAANLSERMFTKNPSRNWMVRRGHNFYMAAICVIAMIAGWSGYHFGRDQGHAMGVGEQMVEDSRIYIDSPLRLAEYQNLADVYTKFNTTDVSLKLHALLTARNDSLLMAQPFEREHPLYQSLDW